MLDRGVYVAPYRVRGREVLLAIDHAGNLRAQRLAPESWPLIAAARALQAWLDRRFPAPSLRLVDERPAEPPPPPIRPLPPAVNYVRSQTRAWLMRDARS